MGDPTKVFISYSWESPEHRQWVRSLAARLRRDGVDVMLDQWHAAPGDQLPEFMERSIRGSDFVLIVCTPHYKEKADARAGGVGYEGDIITSEVLVTRNQRKFIPILCRGEWEEAGPSSLLGNYYIDLRGQPYSEQHYVDLLTTLRGEREEAPQLGFPQDPKQWPRELTNNIGMEFVLIPAGQFEMGSTDGERDERPVHTVWISHPFYLGKYPVTQTQWEAVMGSNPSEYEGGDRPVENVSWDDTQAFLRRLNEQDKDRHYQLPTEAEWEYAARAGSRGAYCFGDDENQLSEYAWYEGNSGSETHPVGQLKPNDWGLYDMHGNVCEWVQDSYAVDYYHHSPEKDPPGPAARSFRVARGGAACLFPPIYARCAARLWNDPDWRYNYLGFRVAMLPKL